MNYLGDCHIHMILDAIYFREAIDRHRELVQEDYVRGVLEKYRQLGITYLRDGGDTCGVALLASRLAPEYGIEYRMPVFAMHRAGRYGKIVGFPYRDMAEFTEMMKKAKSERADFIKIMVSGILDFHEYGKLSCPSLSREEIRELVDRVHQENMSVMLHINGRDAILAAVEAGADSLEHGFYMDEECCQALGEHPETVWIPSIAPVGNQIGSGRFPDKVLSAIVRNQQENIRRVYRAGGRIALGSDAGAFLVPHGEAIADERRYLVEALAGEKNCAISEENLASGQKEQSDNWDDGRRNLTGDSRSNRWIDDMLRDNEAWIRRRFVRR